MLSRITDIHATTFAHAHLREAMLETIAQLNAWAKEAGVTEPSLLNFAVTDGQSVVATRYVSSTTDEAASLYFSTGYVLHRQLEARLKCRKHLVLRDVAWQRSLPYAQGAWRLLV
jgi:glutamine amidotransferase